MSETTPPDLFPIMSVSYRYQEDIPKLRKAGVQNLVIGIPWAMIGPHEAQARANHGQTLQRLAERGGLGVCEAVAVLEDRRWHSMPNGSAHHELARKLAEYNERIAERLRATEFVPEPPCSDVPA